MSTYLVLTEYKAGTATYPGDCRHIIGETKGPTTLGQWVHATAAEYDAQTDSTRVTFNVLDERADQP